MQCISVKSERLEKKNFRKKNMASVEEKVIELGRNSSNIRWHIPYFEISER